MRASEILHAIVFLYFVALAWRLKVPARNRAVILIRSAAVLVLVLTLPRLAHTSSIALSVIRDWLPAPLMLFTYWTSGLLAVGSNARLASALLSIDRRLLSRLEFRPNRLPALAGQFLELAYLLCYVLVPMGLGCLYLLRLGCHAEDYWAVVLPPTYVCYAAVPFFRTLPPRLHPGDPVGEPPPSPLRAFNLWILEKGSIAFNTFPSAHVAASGAAALAVFHQAPAIGMLFFAGATGIALGSVYGRYHYAADAVAGASLALVSYFGWRCLS